MAKEDKASSECLRLILVVFLGGCTFSEISALRFLGREKGKREHNGMWGTKGSAQEGLSPGPGAPLTESSCGLGGRAPFPPRGAAHWRETVAQAIGV